MSRIRRFAATFALVAMTLSLGEGLLASACAEDATAAEMSMMTHEGHDPEPMNDDGPGEHRSPSDCPMSTAAISSCAASAILTHPSNGVLTHPVTAERRTADSPHIPASFHALGLFRPPIA